MSRASLSPVLESLAAAIAVELWQSVTKEQDAVASGTPEELLNVTSNRSTLPAPRARG